ncbi:MAG: hypothetical protein PHT75_02060 [Bacilli bacterium]|nr:hypothetical protein [Bacilli bacterium]MDD3304895.1 hypothetical protein [Bacilli bacterium]MDD4053505.1 hypothetical protein [Bacilli bacterium]MDD4411540.1 hypothetical protein [Bacilli bacterium]
MEQVIIILLFVFIIFFRLLPQIKKKNNKVTIFFIMAISFSFPLIFLDSLDFDLPSPVSFIEFIIDSIFKKG